MDPERMPARYARRLFRSCFLTAASVLAALWSAQYAFALVSSAVLASSVNYWRRPVYGWRRRIDIGTVAAGGAYQLYRAHDSTRCAAYVATCLFAAACYAMGRTSGNYNRSTAWHVGVHLCANGGNIILYTAAEK